MTTPDIFLSYNREDAATAKRFADAFAAEGLNVWWDTALRSGEAYDEVTEAALRGAKAVVVLWSPRSVASRWVRAEATIADRCKTLVPVMIESCERPIMFELTQTADLVHWSGDPGDAAWLAFLGDVWRFVGKEQTEPSTRPAKELKSGRVTGTSRRKLLIASGGSALMLAGAGFSAWKAGLFKTAGSENSVAVLPFKNLSGDPGQDYFADGIAEEIRSSLSLNPMLKVVAGASSGMFRKQAEPIHSIAAKLGVAYILDGSVRRAGGTVRIVAQLIDGETGFSTWSRTFDRAFKDLLAIQAELGRTVADVLTAQTGGAGVVNASTDLTRSGGTVSPAAFDAYLRGESEKAGMEAALAEYETAITLDPRYAAAYVSRALTLFYMRYSAADLGESRRLADLALKSARRAVELAPNFAIAQSAMAVILRANLRFRESRLFDDRSFELGQGSVSVLTNFALNSSASRRLEPAFRAINRAVLLDPLNANTWMGLSHVQFWAKQYEQSIHSAKKGIEVDPNYDGRWINEHTARRLFAMKRYEEVRSLLPKFIDAGSMEFYAALLENRAGQSGSARKALAKLETDGDETLFLQAQLLAQMGETQQAIAALEKAYALKDGMLGDLAVEPLLDPLRNVPQFISLLDRVGVAA